MGALFLYYTFIETPTLFLNKPLAVASFSYIQTVTSQYTTRLRDIPI